jgi:2-keto-3-deoxy-L-rhamnonate aldolase RhmA
MCSSHKTRYARYWNACQGVRGECTDVIQAFGIKIAPTPEIAMIAKTAGYDSLFIDMEHTTMSLKNVAALSATALGVGITPFVRVPWQSGHGFVQRVLDAGAMGVIYPHISSVGT